MSDIDKYHNPQSWYSTNLVGIPAWLIASTEFNDHPQRLRIAGARETHRGLFHLLEEASDMADAAEKFQRYMDIVFQLHPSEYEIQHAEKRRFRPSYHKLMEGWGFDSNSPQGAVLKGWVESRFGMSPSFHRVPLQHYPSEAWMHYLEEKFSSRFHSNSIQMQLDLLYEYCQFVVQRFHLPFGDWVTLWRGVNSHDEPTMSDTQLKKGQCLVKLNNLVSFTTSRERADEFGDWILEVKVPVVKLLFFPGLLGKPILAGEGEVLALGGYFQVKASYA
ncbi:MAG: NAD(+) ADP-ribosyltransferase [Methylophilaceae bacterium]|nr:NAD(+) ADP-ribosyltransferase [Methylophilaceae bacterium]